MEMGSDGDGVRSCNQTSDVGLHGEILTALTAPRPRHTTISVVESEPAHPPPSPSIEPQYLDSGRGKS